MFPPQNNPAPGTQVTGNENEFEQFLSTEISRQLEARMRAQNPAAGPVAPTPITINMAGQSATFANEAELNKWLNDYNQRMSAQVAQNQPQPAAQPGSFVTGDESKDAPQYNLDQFVEKLTKDRPGAALMDALKAEGVDLQAISEALKRQEQSVQEQAQVMAAARFKETFPDFPPNVAAAQKLNMLREKLNQPFTFEGLAATYALADRMGQFNEFRQAPSQQNPYQNPYQQPAFNPPQGFTPGFQPVAAPPRAGRSGGYEPSPDVYSQAENLTTDELAELLNKFGGR